MAIVREGEERLDGLLDLGDGGLGLCANTLLPRVKALHLPREEVFRVVDAAFAHRRKQIRPALRELAGSAEAATAALECAGIDPTVRGEMLAVGDFARIAEGLAVSAGRA